MPENTWDPNDPDEANYFDNLWVAPEDMSDFADFVADMVMEVAKEAKIEMTRNGPVDLDPKMIYMTDREPGLKHLMLSQFTDLIPAPVGVGLAMRVAREHYGPPVFVMFITEGYMKVFEKGDPLAARLERGDITAMPDRHECITMNIQHRKADGTLRILHIAQPFHYADGSVVWDEEHRLDSEIEGGEMGGAITEVITASFDMQSN